MFTNVISGVEHGFEVILLLKLKFHLSFSTQRLKMTIFCRFLAIFHLLMLKFSLVCSNICNSQIFQYIFKCRAQFWSKNNGQAQNSTCQPSPKGSKLTFCMIFVAFFNLLKFLLVTACSYFNRIFSPVLL